MITMAAATKHLALLAGVLTEAVLRRTFDALTATGRSVLTASKQRALWVSRVWLKFLQVHPLAG